MVPFDMVVTPLPPNSSLIVSVPPVMSTSPSFKNSVTDPPAEPRTFIAPELRASEPLLTKMPPVPTALSVSVPPLTVSAPPLLIVVTPPVALRVTVSVPPLTVSEPPDWTVRLRIALVGVEETIGSFVTRPG